MVCLDNQMNNQLEQHFEMGIIILQCRTKFQVQEQNLLHHSNIHLNMILMVRSNLEFHNIYQQYIINNQLTLYFQELKSKFLQGKEQVKMSLMGNNNLLDIHQKQQMYFKQDNNIQLYKDQLVLEDQLQHNSYQDHKEFELQFPQDNNIQLHINLHLNYQQEQVMLILINKSILLNKFLLVRLILKLHSIFLLHKEGNLNQILLL